MPGTCCRSKARTSEPQVTGSSPVGRTSGKVSAWVDVALTPARDSPIDHRAVVLVVALGAAPPVPDLLLDRVLVQLDPQPRPGRHLHESALHHEWFLQIAL